MRCKNKINFKPMHSSCIKCMNACMNIVHIRNFIIDWKTTHNIYAGVAKLNLCTITEEENILSKNEHGFFKFQIVIKCQTEFLISYKLFAISDLNLRNHVSGRFSWCQAAETSLECSLVQCQISFRNIYLNYLFSQHSY